MTRRIRIILFWVFLSSLGIILLQGYWITKLYIVKKEQLLKDLNLALEVSVMKEMNNRLISNRDFISHGNGISINKLKNNTIPFETLDSTIMKTHGVNTENSTQFTMQLNGIDNIKERSDSITELKELRAKDLILGVLENDLSGRFQVNLREIDSLFSEELKERGIKVLYHLELIDVSLDALINRPAKFADDTVKSMLTRSFQVDLFGKQNVRVRIPHEQKVVLEKMLTGVFASLLLLLLVLICFIYMLRTIFKQKQLSQIKNDFINNMTHELKTPIATVSAVVESMQSFGVLDDIDKTRKYLHVSQKELGRLSALVEKVLNMARDEREPIKMNPEVLNFRELCESVIICQKVKDLSKDVEFCLLIDKDAEEMFVDRFHVVNVMQNLIENSIKYSGDNVKITIECKRENGQLSIRVRDNGIGISKKYQAKVFDQFYRVPTGDVHNVKGFGLGLHYVRNIVLKHSGKIGLISDEGKGSTFIINLPC